MKAGQWVLIFGFFLSFLLACRKEEAMVLKTEELLQENRDLKRQLEEAGNQNQGS